MLQFYGYNKCGTCRKAKQWLDARDLSFREIDITQKPPSLAQLKRLYQASGKELKAFLNTSGLQYRALNMKEKLKQLSELEVLKMLAQEGRLIKRPLVTDGKRVTVGFREEEFSTAWSS